MGSMEAHLFWYLLIGPLLLLIALIGTRVQRWPLSTAMIYLVIGVILGRLGWLDIEVLRNSQLLRIASEVAVIISLFSAGLRLRIPLSATAWRLPVGLATLGMAFTILLLAALGVVALSLPLGAAIVLGAALAPTDPVLAADVQVADTDDQDPVRLSLTGEAGLNDGTAFPFLLLGLGLLGVQGSDFNLTRWLAVDVLWQVLGGVALGAGLGWGTTKLVVFLRQHHGEAFGFDDFLALGIVATAYGFAELIHVYGFIAVFAAGWSLRGVERRDTPRTGPRADATRLKASARKQPSPEPAIVADAVLRFNSQMDRIGELALVLLTGALLATLPFDLTGAALAAILMLIIRPIAVGPLCMAAGMRPSQTALISWFGIRGIGSLFYLAYAVTHGLPEEFVAPLSSLVLTVIAISTFAHGITSTPAMRAYARAIEPAERR